MAKTDTFKPLTDDQLQDAHSVLAKLTEKKGFKSQLLWRALEELMERRRIERGDPLDDDERQLLLPRVIQDRGFRYDRTLHPSGDLEKAFADQWEEENVSRSCLNRGNGVLQALFVEYMGGIFGGSWPSRWVLVITARDRYVVATVIQWLGSNIGFGFLCKCLEKVGYRVERVRDRRRA